MTFCLTSRVTHIKTVVHIRFRESCSAEREKAVFGSSTVGGFPNVTDLKYFQPGFFFLNWLPYVVQTKIEVQIKHSCNGHGCISMFG